MTDSFEKENEAIFMRYFAIFPKIRTILFKKQDLDKSPEIWTYLEALEIKRFIFYALLYIAVLVLINHRVFSGPWGLYRVILGLGQYQKIVLKSPGIANIKLLLWTDHRTVPLSFAKQFFVEAIMNWRIRIVTNAKKLNNQNDLIPETLYLAGERGGRNGGGAKNIGH